jgi:pSer/pThr/pTyr-binding forkhead associated (FHA) protein
MTRWRDSGAYRRKRRAFRPERKKRRRQANGEFEVPEHDPDDPANDLALVRMPWEKRPLLEERPGFLATMFGWLKKKDKAEPKQAAVPPPADDPVRQILSVPRGIARLDAFERVLDELIGIPDAARPVALAYRRELLQLAEKAQVDLSLLTGRAERCASALLESGEVEKAGALLAKIGKRKRAAELFVALGAIEQLELLHADEELEREGGTRLSARLAYERFEGLFAVGLRKEALGALEEAARLWPDNPVYGEIVERFQERVPRGSVTLSIDGARVTFSGEWPLNLGRGEGSVLPLASPLISREHVELARQGKQVFARDLQARGDVQVNGAPVREAERLVGAGELSIGGVVLGFDVDEARVLLWAAQASDVKAVGVLGGPNDDVRVDETTLRLSFDREGRALLSPDDRAVVVDGIQVKNPLVLLRGDTVRLGTETLTVV